MTQHMHTLIAFVLSFITCNLFLNEYLTTKEEREYWRKYFFK